MIYFVEDDANIRSYLRNLINNSDTCFAVIAEADNGLSGAKLAKKIPVFPDYENKRSMLYIDNLCECVRQIIDNDEKGYFYPQNIEYVKTSNLVKTINPNIKMVKIFNVFISLVC